MAVDSYSIPIIDLAAATRDGAPGDVLSEIRAATEETGIIQVVNHGVPEGLIADFTARTDRLLSLPLGAESRAGQPDRAPVPGLAAVARRLRPPRARAVQRRPVRQRRRRPGGRPGRGVPRPVRARQRLAGRRRGPA